MTSGSTPSPAPDPTPDAARASGAPSGHEAVVAHLRPMQMTSASIVFGGVSLAAVRVAIDPAVRTPSVLAVAIVAVAVIAATVLITRVGYSVPALPTGLPRENAVHTAMRYFGSTTVTRAAIAELPVLVAFFVSLAIEPKSWLTLLLAVPVTMGLWWAHVRPSPRTAAAVERGLEAGGARSYLRETLGWS